MLQVRLPAKVGPHDLKALIKNEFTKVYEAGKKRPIKWVPLKIVTFIPSLRSLFERQQAMLWMQGSWAESVGGKLQGNEIWIKDEA